jgi:hypothetical protein
VSTSPETETSEVFDFLSDLEFSTPLVTQRVRLHRIRQRALKQYTSCQKCSQPLIKYGVQWGTDDVEKAICKVCKAAPIGCAHPRLRSFTFADGQTIKMCADCTTFDSKRHRSLCKGEALKDCTATTKPIIRRNYEKKRDGPPSTCGMAHIIGRQRDEFRTTDSLSDCFGRMKIMVLTYKEEREQSEDLRTGELFLRKPQPKAPASIPVIRVVAERTVKLTQYVVKEEPDWVVASLPCTKIVKEIADWNKFYTSLRRWWSFWCVYTEPDRHIPERTTGSDVRPTIFEPACTWPGFRDKTLGKTRGILHTIGGRLCKCSECSEQRRNR